MAPQMLHGRVQPGQRFAGAVMGRICLAQAGKDLVKQGVKTQPVCVGIQYPELFHLQPEAGKLLLIGRRKQPGPGTGQLCREVHQTVAPVSQRIHRVCFSLRDEQHISCPGQTGFVTEDIAAFSL